MHNEELGLLKKEVTFIYDMLNSVEKKEVNTRLSEMPSVPGFPTPNRPLSYAKHFKAKEWIAIAKVILFVCEGRYFYITVIYFIFYCRSY